jgi:hypothetical protein
VAFGFCDSTHQPPPRDDVAPADRETRLVSRSPPPLEGVHDWDSDESKMIVVPHGAMPDPRVVAPGSGRSILASRRNDDRVANVHSEQLPVTQLYLAVFDRRD